MPWPFTAPNALQRAPQNGPAERWRSAAPHDGADRVEMGGHGAGPAYLLLRVPFQFLLIGWAYRFAVRRGHT